MQKCFAQLFIAFGIFQTIFNLKLTQLEIFGLVFYIKETNSIIYNSTILKYGTLDSLGYITASYVLTECTFIPNYQARYALKNSMIYLTTLFDDQNYCVINLNQMIQTGISYVQMLKKPALYYSCTTYQIIDMGIIFIQHVMIQVIVLQYNLQLLKDSFSKLVMWYINQALLALIQQFMANITQFWTTKFLLVIISMSFNFKQISFLFNKQIYQLSLSKLLIQLTFYFMMSRISDKFQLLVIFFHTQVQINNISNILISLQFKTPTMNQNIMLNNKKYKLQLPDEVNYLAILKMLTIIDFIMDLPALLQIKLKLASI
ncbi:hypothetical protein ABPG72_012054 [Tetrahymena utriculariae]